MISYQVVPRFWNVWVQWPQPDPRVCLNDFGNRITELCQILLLENDVEQRKNTCDESTSNTNTDFKIKITSWELTYPHIPISPYPHIPINFNKNVLLSRWCSPFPVWWDMWSFPVEGTGLKEISVNLWCFVMLCPGCWSIFGSSKATSLTADRDSF